MLNVYATNWCPHCKKTVDFLNEKKIKYNYIDMDGTIDQEILKKVIDVNGGDDWVVPTLEFRGKWRKGQFFNAAHLFNDLKEMGVIN